MSVTSIEGDWEFISEKVIYFMHISIIIILWNIQGYDPMKVSIKNIMGPDWIVACMIPNGNMIASILKKIDEQNGFQLVSFNCSIKKDTPKEDKDLESDFKSFLGQGISSLVRDDGFHI